MRNFNRILPLTFFLLSLSACTSSEVEMVKAGALEMCPDTSVEVMVDSFMGDPSWDSGITDDGKSFVNVGGNITLREKPVHALVQFMVNEEQGTFNYQAFEINEVPQNYFMANGLLNKMCQSAK